MIDSEEMRYFSASDWKAAEGALLSRNGAEGKKGPLILSRPLNQ
jgi:hypothetical protein